MSKPPASAEYSIASVSKLTGVSCHTLRVWERRHGFPRPYRTVSGHRRYSHEQVELLLRVVEQIQRGQSIGELVVDLRSEPDGASASVPTAADSSATGQARELVDRLIRGDVEGGEAHFDTLAAAADPVELVVRVIEPALIDVGERWFRQECEVFQERGVSRFLHRKLEVLIEEARRANGSPAHSLLVGTVQGDHHSGGVLMLHLLMERSGWRVRNMGVDLPVHEYENAVKLWRPDALGLSFVLSRSINKRFQELSRIRGVPIFVGGRSILNYQSLARRYGLIPLPGPITSAVERLIDDFDEWTRTGDAAAGPT